MKFVNMKQISSLVGLAAVLTITGGCGSKSDPQETNKTKLYDGGFRGAFRSTTFECQNGETKVIADASSVKRVMVVTSTEIGVTDYNSRSYLISGTSSPTDKAEEFVFMREYKVNRLEMVKDSTVSDRKAELAQNPDAGWSYANAIGDVQITDDRLHPLSRLQKNLQGYSFTYHWEKPVSDDRTLPHVLKVIQTNVPNSVCAQQGSDLVITFEKIQL